MNFIDTVLHDLVMLESDMIDAQKELKKLKKVNVIEGVLIAYLLLKDREKVVHGKTIEEKCKEKCKKWFDRRREK